MANQTTGVGKKKKNFLEKLLLVIEYGQHIYSISFEHNSDFGIRCKVNNFHPVLSDLNEIRDDAEKMAFYVFMYIHCTSSS